MTRPNKSTHNIPLEAAVTGDGSVELRWGGEQVDRYHLLIIRTGAIAAYTSVQLAGTTRRYGITGLSRHQRYLMAVLGNRGSSSWISVTPRAGLEPWPALDQERGAQAHLGRLTRLTVMPQDRRLTLYWQVSPGFVDAFIVELRAGGRAAGPPRAGAERPVTPRAGRVVKELSVEPEVTSVSLDRSRGFQLKNGEVYTVRVRTRFASLSGEGPAGVVCTPAPQGQERRANREHPQTGLVYPFLDLTPEVRVFDDDEGEQEAEGGARIICYHCRGEVQWRNYRLLCGECGAEFIPNGRGHYLDIGRLRFGTCKCCLPKKILIQRPGSKALICAHSGKEHIRLPGSDEMHLIEDLPFGLCQCCRPRRPLVRKGRTVRCSKSDEAHHADSGAYILAPSQPVFDAAAIDELLDAGMAEICASGVSRGR